MRRSPRPRCAVAPDGQGQGRRRDCARSLSSRRTSPSRQRDDGGRLSNIRNPRKTFPQVQRRKVILPLRVTHVHDSVPCEKHAVAPVPGRHHAVEHVDAPGYPLQDVGRSPDSHEIAWLVLRQKRAGDFQHPVHFFGGFADSESTHGETSNSRMVPDKVQAWSTALLRSSG